MKNIFLALTLLFAVNTIAQEEINWMTLEEAVALQEKEPRKIMMDAYTSWCGPCKLLDARTFKNKDLVAYVNTHFYAVKFNAEGNEEVNFKGKVYKNPSYDPAKAQKRNSSHELSRGLGIRAYPTLLFFDEDAKLIAPITGYKKPQDLEMYLKMFQTNKHLDMKTQAQFDEYYKAFIAEFKDNV
ncbi:thioredoxin family protein [Psychroserpens sp. NJDZ02]|uniref:thioredoxin family protein n=1 Tax=Psychroserpens sp. NJDZ02 TaxID=2570561 RepID=UPI0010A859CF|nr:thioredoxin fold domain-containing protein [Psychroserpens sp. NJDZ02]QCE40703.1 DUF255 domain-containing protein [Psychroserpens sp. NJDZ02]